MMTALLSVGAWAQSLQTVTLFEGTQATTSASHLSIDKENFKGARVGSQLNIYYTITAGNNVCYFGNGWKSTWSNADGTSVSVLLDNDVISSVYGLDIHPQNEGVTMTVTKVTLSYNGVNLLSSESGISPHIWGGAQQLKKGLFAHATEGDVLSVNVSAISQSWKKMFLTSGQGNPEDMNDAVNVYNSTPSETEIALSASSFTDIVVGSYIHFTTTKGGIEAKSSGTTLASNLYWNEISFYVTAENISTIQTNGITVTVTETSDNTLTVTKKNPKNTCPTEYWRTEDLTVGEKVNIPLTSALLGYAREGEGDGNLYLSGNDYSTTSVDLIYQPSAVNIGSAGYATFGYPFAVDLSGLGEGQDAYTVTVSGDKAQLTSVKGKKIPANTGIILTGSGNVTIPLTTETTDDVSGNQLLVSDGTKTGDGSSIYVLANGTNGVGFYKLESGDAIAAGKAYLQVTPPSASSFFDIDDGTTGITMVQGEGFMVNGSDIYYDLQGRRVAKPTKGLYIVNGKKVIIK